MCVCNAFIHLPSIVADGVSPPIAYLSPATVQAAARQQQFEQSAVGRATMKAVRDAKKKETRPEGPDLAQDWRS